MSVLKILGVALIGTIGLTFAAWIYAINQVEPPPTSRYSEMRERIQGEKLNSVAIAPVRDAITLARFQAATGLRLMRVHSYEGGQVSGIDITAMQADQETPDPVALWNQAGYDAIATAPGPAVTVQASQLATPFESTDAHIAMGGTYPAHAKEATLEAPFLFPKLQRAQAWNSPVPVKHHLLDYEIELGFVALQPVSRAGSGGQFGLVLASDYTDRALMLREIDFYDTHSGQGFTGAKSVTPMPVGGLLVIPRDLRSFYKTLDLRLYVNGELRQIARPRELAWEIDRMVAESFARSNTAFRYADATVALPISQGVIPAQTIVLSGTTDGVAFRPPSGRQIFTGVVEWLATFRWGNPRLLIERTIAEAYANRYHLQAGDRVLMRADHLGFIENPIVP